MTLIPNKIMVSGVTVEEVLLHVVPEMAPLYLLVKKMKATPGTVIGVEWLEDDLKPLERKGL